MYWYVSVRGVFYGRMSWGRLDDVILVHILMLLEVLVLFYICCDG